jgi:putative two-component system response regulator
LFLAAAQALKRSKGTGNSVVRLPCLHACFLYFFHHGHSEAALDVANEHYALAKQTGSLDGLRLSHNLMGILNADLGNIGDALVHYLEALELARRLKDTLAECHVLNNLGAALNYAGLYREAIPCFTKIISVAQPHWRYPLDKKAYANLAQAHYYLERFDDALDAIRRSLVRPCEPACASDFFEQTIREFTLVQIALELGRFDLASEHATACQKHANAANSSRGEIMANIALARCEVRGGNVQKGLSSLEQTLEISRELDSNYRDVLVAIVKAYDEAQRPEIALRYMEQLLAHVRDHRSNGVRTLLSLSRDEIVDAGTVSGNADLRAFEYKHADLRARVAERDASNSRLEMLERLAVTADLKEDASGEHGYRVGKLSALLAESIGWSAESALSLELAARLHDIGKIGIPDRILGSSETLKDAERHFMSMHATIGAELLAKSNVPQLRMAEGIARHHHEWWNGAGYPDKLSGTRIPVHARIVALADVFDALTHGRPFSQPWDIDRAVVEIRSRRGTQFEPRLTDRFLALVSELRAEHADLDQYLARAGSASPFRQARQTIRALLDAEQVRDSEGLAEAGATLH